MPVLGPPPRPRPRDVDAVRRAAAHLGMAPHEITDAVDSPDEGIIVTTHDGHRQLIDGDGRVWWYGYTPGMKPTQGGPPNAGLPLWNGRAGSALPKSEPWRVADLAQEAALIPNPGDHGSGRVLQQWIGDDPVKAFAFWSGFAAHHALSMREAIERSPDVAMARKVILDSHWLAADEAAQL